MYLKTWCYREVGKNTFIDFIINKHYISSGLKLSSTKKNSPGRILPQAEPVAG